MGQRDSPIGRRSVLKSTLAAAGLVAVGGKAAASTSLAVSTSPSQSESHDTAALWGSLDDMGGASSVDVTFEWREDGASSWNTSRTETVTTTGSIRHYIKGLSSGTTYEFRLTATASTGDTATGSTNTFTTDSSPTYKASTEIATDVSDTSAVLNGTIDEFPDVDSVEVFFRWGPAGGPSGDIPGNNTLPWDLTSAGEFSEEITDLDPDTDYEFWFVTDSGGDFDRGEARLVRDGTSSSTFALSTDSATASDTSATLVGSVDDLGAADSADVAFEWRKVGASSWNATSTQTVSSTGTYSAELTGLPEETDHEYRAVGTASNGETEEGSIKSFYTTGDPSVQTDDPTNVEDTSAQFNGRLESDGGADSVDVSFEWGPEGDFSNTITDVSSSDDFSISIGSFYADVTGLDKSTTYNYRAVVDASDGESDTGDPVSFTTMEDPQLSVDTERPTNVTDTSATLQGTLNSLGGASSVDVYFEYDSIDGTVTETSTQTLTSTGSFSADISGLDPDTTYDYRVIASASDGDTDSTAWSQFTTDQQTTESTLTVSAQQPSNVTTSGATIEGALDDLGGASSVDVSFEWRPVGGSLTQTSTQTLSSTGSFSAELSGLDSDTEYEYQAIANASDGDSAASSFVSFKTNQTSSAPTVDSLSLSTADKPNPHAEITADWAVSDADGNLSSVTVQVIDGSSVVDSASSSVSGGTASGTDQFKIKKGGNTTYDVRVIVKDTDGLNDTKTKRVTAR